MAEPAPCDAGYTDALGKEYLRTISGRTTEDPIGFICLPADVGEWRLSIIRIRTALGDAMKRVESGNVPMPKGMGQRVASWVFKSLSVPKGTFYPHGTSSRVCKEDVAKATDFGKRGVTILSELHCALVKGGGEVPGVPSTRPPARQLPYGTGFWALVLVVGGIWGLAYLKGKKG